MSSHSPGTRAVPGTGWAQHVPCPDGHHRAHFCRFESQCQRGKRQKGCPSWQEALTDREGGSSWCPAWLSFQENKLHIWLEINGGQGLEILSLDPLCLHEVRGPTEGKVQPSLCFTCREWRWLAWSSLWLVAGTGPCLWAGNQQTDLSTDVSWEGLCTAF